MGISKRAFGVAGYQSSPRPVPLIADLMAMAPKEVSVNGKSFGFRWVKVDAKKLVHFCYKAAGCEDVCVTIKLSLIDEVANQKWAITHMIRDMLSEGS